MNVFYSWQSELKENETYLRNYKDKNTTNYRKLICVYDLIKYGKNDYNN